MSDIKKATSEKAWDLTVDIQKFEEDYKEVEVVAGEVPIKPDEYIGLGEIPSKIERLKKTTNIYDRVFYELSTDTDNSYLSYNGYRVIGVSRTEKTEVFPGSRFFLNNVLARSNEDQMHSLRENYSKSKVELGLYIDGNIKWVDAPPIFTGFSRVTTHSIDI